MTINWSELQGGKYLNAKNLPNGRLVLTITSVVVEDIGTPAVPKAVVYGEEDERGLVLNATRRSVLREALGDDDARWIGRRLLITIGKAMFQGKSVDSLVVKVFPQTIKKAQSPVKVVEDQTDETPAPDDPDWETADEA